MKFLLEEKRVLNALLILIPGYVLGYSDKTFRNQVIELTGIDIYSEQYVDLSKAKRFNAFIEQENASIVLPLLKKLISHRVILGINFALSIPV